MPPYLHNALVLLGVALGLPLVAGLIARAFFFRRDADDIRNRK